MLYDADHNLLAVEHMLFNPTIVLVDTTVIASAPAAFFRAGLGDAVSKKFEAERAAATADPICMAASRPWPRNCWPRAACASCWKTAPRRWQRRHRPARRPERAVEAMILSGLGFESGGLSIAHALTRGLPRIAGLATSAHGLQVALGLLVQLDLEARDDGLLAELTRWYAQVGLPVSLRELGATAPTDAELETAAALTNARHAASFDRTLSVAELAAALRRRA